MEEIKMGHFFAPLAQVLPPIQPRGGFDLVNFLVNAVAALLWSVVAALIFSMVVIVAMRIFSALTPGIDELQELKNGNVAVALVMLAFILAVSGVVMVVLLK
jgi:uncharacterized membrane protein YjfL (UPF0719 family)